MGVIAEEQGVGPVDGVVLDIGVSSMQLNDAERGFSFQADGPLDMRMSQSGPTAADVVNGSGRGDAGRHSLSPGRGAPLARHRAGHRGGSGRQRRSRRRASLADLVPRVLGGAQEMVNIPRRAHSRPCAFYVNDELGELARGLSAAERCLRPGGRLVVVTFHSLEDRIVKRFFNTRAGKEERGSRHLPEQSIKSAPRVSKLLTSVR